MFADCFKYILHGNVFSAELAGEDIAAIHEYARHVEADHRHHQPGQ